MPDGPDAEALFDLYLDQLEAHEGADFERYVAQYPRHERELRSLWTRWSQLDARLESALPEALVDESFFHGTEHAAVVAGPTVAAVPGAIIAGDFRLLRRIGKGGMGHVWEAEQLSLSRRVALKLLRPGRTDSSSVQLLGREARAGGRLTHPGLVTVYAAGEADGVHYIAQELVGEGLTLASWIERQRSRPASNARTYRELAELLATVAEAVQVAHDAGILHRDLKPSNILIGPDDRPRVSDFGLAYLPGESADARPGLLGTWPYMSPEQAGGDGIAIDGRSDVFSLGAVMYEALTLRRAFEGDTGDMILERVLSYDPPDPRRYRSRVPEDLAVICLAALAKDRRARYAGMGEMAADLRRFLADEPIKARRQGWRTVALKWSRRHPAWTTAMTLVSAALVVISLLLANEVVLRQKAESEQARADQLALQAQRNAELAAERASEAERQGYLAAIRASAMHLERNDHAAARAMLGRVASHRRGWEWRHAALRADTVRLRLTGHTGAVTAVALSADGQLVASASEDASVRLWDGADGAALATLLGHATAVRAVALSADGARLVSGGADGSLLLWDGAGARVAARLEPHGAAITTVALSRSGDILASASEDGHVRVQRFSDDGGYELPAESLTGPISLALSADGSRLATASSRGKSLVYDLLPEAAALVSERYWFEGIVVALGAGGSPMVAGSADGIVLAWDPETFSGDVSPDAPGVTSVRAHGHPVSHLALSDDGRRLVSASSEANDAFVFDLLTGELQTVLTGHERQLMALALSADGGTVVAGCSDGTALLWDAATPGASVPLLGHEHAVSAVAASADGGVIVSGGLTGGRALLWDGVTGRLIATLPDHAIGVRAAAISADGSLLVSAASDRFVRLWSGTDGAPLPHLVGHDARVTSVAVDGAGRLVASGSLDHTARLWDPASGRTLASVELTGTAVSSVALDAAGSTLLIGAQDGSVLLARAPWDAPVQLRAGSADGDGVVALSADGSTACWASASDDLVLVWNTSDGRPRAILQGAHRGLAAVALSADGSRVLSVAVRGDSMRLRETDSGETLALLRGHDGPITAVTLSADGRRIISGGRDRSVRIWESERASASALWDARALHPRR